MSGSLANSSRYCAQRCVKSIVGPHLISVTKRDTDGITAGRMLSAVRIHYGGGLLPPKVARQLQCASRAAAVTQIIPVIERKSQRHRGTVLVEGLVVSKDHNLRSPRSGHLPPLTTHHSPLTASGARLHHSPLTQPAAGPVVPGMPVVWPSDCSLLQSIAGFWAMFPRPLAARNTQWWSIGRGSHDPTLCKPTV
jgi:hypothetical protein